MSSPSKPLLASRSTADATSSARVAASLAQPEKWVLFVQPPMDRASFSSRPAAAQAVRDGLLALEQEAFGGLAGGSGSGSGGPASFAAAAGRELELLERQGLAAKDER